jgi:hypothetical protein
MLTPEDRVFTLTRLIAELKRQLPEDFRKGDHARKRLSLERVFTAQLSTRLALLSSSAPVPATLWESLETEVLSQQRRNSEYADFQRLKIRVPNSASYPDKRHLLELYDAFESTTTKQLAMIDRSIAVARETLRLAQTDLEQTLQKTMQWTTEQRESVKQLSKLKNTTQVWKQKNEDLTRQLVQIHGSINVIVPTFSSTEAPEVRCFRAAIGTEMLRNRQLYAQLRYMEKQRRLFQAKLRATVLELKNHGEGDSRVEGSFASLYQRNQAMYALVEDLQTLNKIRDIDHAVAFIINAICRSVEADRASYWICDPAKNSAWTKKGTHNLAGMETLVIPLTTGFVGVCYREKKIVNVQDAYLDPRFNRSVDLKTGYRTKAVLCVPVLGPDGVTVVGVAQAINKISPSAAKFDEDDAHRLSVLGYAMLNVLGSCQTHEEHEKNVRRRDTIIDNAEEILRRASSKKDLINLIVEKNGEIWRATNTAIWVVYKDFVSRVSVDREGGVMTYDQPINLGLVGKVITTKKPHHATYPIEDPALDANIDIDMHQAGRLHTWPIFHGEEIVCVVQWATIGKNTVTFGDNGTFNENYPAHVHLAELFLGKIVGNFVERLWPWQWRKIWTKAKRQKLKVRCLVSLEPPEGPDGDKIIAAISIQRWFREGYTVSALASLFTYSLKRRK